MYVYLDGPKGVRDHLYPELLSDGYGTSYYIHLSFLLRRFPLVCLSNGITKFSFFHSDGILPFQNLCHCYSNNYLMELLFVTF